MLLVFQEDREISGELECSALTVAVLAAALKSNQPNSTKQPRLLVGGAWFVHAHNFNVELVFRQKWEGNA